MFCTTCGAQIRDNSKFCTNCGAAVAKPRPTGDVITIPPVKTSAPDISPAGKTGNIFCTKCGAQIRDNSKFCTKCGANAPVKPQPKQDAITIPPVKTPVPEIVQPEIKNKKFCTTCGSQIRDNSKFCTNCGAAAVAEPQPKEDVITIPPVKTFVPEIVPEAEKKKIYCTTCGAQIRDNSKFCTNCGAAAVAKPQPKENVTIPPVKTLVPGIVQPEEKKKICTSCGAQIPADSKFCTNCGASAIIPEKSLPEEVLISAPALEAPMADPYAVEEMNSRSGKRWIYWLFGIIIILAGVAGMVFWTTKPKKQAIADSKLKNDLPITTDSTGGKKNTNTNVQKDTAVKYTKADSAGILKAVGAIIREQEISANKKLLNSKRQELTDSLFSALVNRESPAEVLRSFSQYFIASTPIKIKRYSKQQQLKTVPADRQKKSAKYEKFK